jgi:hypothetical protein
LHDIDGTPYTTLSRDGSERDDVGNHSGRAEQHQRRRQRPAGSIARIVRPLSF